MRAKSPRKCRNRLEGQSLLSEFSNRFTSAVLTATIWIPPGFGVAAPPYVRSMCANHRALDFDAYPPK